MLVASAVDETLDRAKQETRQEAGLQTVALFAMFYFERATCLATSPSGAARRIAAERENARDPHHTLRFPNAMRRRISSFVFNSDTEFFDFSMT
jgi:hypothetical protein